MKGSAEHDVTRSISGSVPSVVEYGGKYPVPNTHYPRGTRRLVVAGGLHHRTRDRLSDQMVTQRQDLAGHRAPSGNGLNSFAAPATGDPDAHLGVSL
jgi:hypothetical protein